MPGYIGGQVQFAIPPSPTATTQSPDIILVISGERLDSKPIIRVHLGDELTLQTSNFTAKALFISDDGRYGGTYLVRPVVKNRNDGFIYFRFSDLRVQASAKTRGKLEFRVYRDDYQYGHTLKTGVYAIDERDREYIGWFKQRTEVYKGIKEGE